MLVYYVLKYSDGCRPPGRVFPGSAQSRAPRPHPTPAQAFMAPPMRIPKFLAGLEHLAQPKSSKTMPKLVYIYIVKNRDLALGCISISKCVEMFSEAISSAMNI